MADEADLAQERLEREEELRLQRFAAANKLPPASFDDDGNQVCAGCGGDMHPVRIKLGFTECIYCVQEQEKEARDYV
jgi:hypothetical protein